MVFWFLTLVSTIAVAWLAVAAAREHRRAVAGRRDLLSQACGVLSETNISHARDQFPIVSGFTHDGCRAKVELVADTMVTRRLPQLWLRVTIAIQGTGDGPVIGALARPTGAEFYSRVHDLPEWMTPPEIGVPMLIRGDGRADAEQAAAMAAHLASLFSDPKVKEAVITPRSASILYQAAEGERAAHLFLRQARFQLEGVPADTIRLAIQKAMALSSVFAENAPAVTSRAA